LFRLNYHAKAFCAGNFLQNQAVFSVIRPFPQVFNTIYNVQKVAGNGQVSPSLLSKRESET